MTEPPDRYGQRRTYPPAAWIGAVLVLIVPVVLVAAADSVNSAGAAETVGSALAVVFMGGLIATVGRAVYVRWIAEGRAVFSPWLLVIAGLVGLALTPGVLDRARQDREDEFASTIAAAAKECDAAGEVAFPALEELEYRPVGPGLQRRAAAAIPAPFIDETELRAVVRGKVKVGYVLAAPLGTDALDAEEARRGFIDGFAEQGGSERTLSLPDGTTVTAGSANGVVGAIVPSECYFRTVATRSFAGAKRLVALIAAAS